MLRQLLCDNSVFERCQNKFKSDYLFSKYLEENMKDWILQCLRPRQHSIGYMGDGFYRSKEPTNSIKVLKEHTKFNCLVLCTTVNNDMANVSMKQEAKLSLG